MSTNSCPRISVIIPVYNGARFLTGALENVFAQTYQPLEVIVVDDGSTDGSATLAASYGEQIRYTYQPNAGPAAARNTGLALATGELITFLDVDDRWPLGKLQAQLQHLVQNPALQLVWGYTQVIHLDHADQSNPAAAAPPSLLPLVGSILFRQEMLVVAGVFDAHLRMSEDVDWFMRIREANVPLQVVSEVALFYRLHEANMTHGKQLIEMKTVYAIKQSLDRRRKQHDGVAPVLAPLLGERTL